MIVPVGVAARTSKRTLLRDFDRDVRAISGKDSTPGLNDFACAHSVARHDDSIMVQTFSVLCYSVVRMPRESRSPRIARRRSRVHGWGVFALEPINKNKR